MTAASDPISIDDKIRFQLSVLSQASDAIFTTDTNHRITYWNTESERLYGFTTEEAFGRNAKELLRQEWLGNGDEREVSEELVKSGAWHGEIIHHTKDGRRLAIRSSMGLLHDGDSGNEGIIFINCHVTDRMEIEERLRKLSTVVEQTADAVSITDTEGVFQYVNPAFEALTQYSSHECLGKTSRILKSGKHDASFYQRLWGTILSGKVFKEVLINRKKNGDLYSSEKTITPLKDKDEKITHFVSTDRDITERIRMEEELVRSNSELQQFTYVASHDLQEPLRTISLYLKLLQSKYQSKLDKDADGYIEFAVDGAKRMKDLIVDLLTYSQVGKAKKTSSSTTNCEEVLSEVTTNLSVAIQENGARIQNGGLPNVRADRVELVQLFQNLIGNAIKYRDETRAPEIQIDAEKKLGDWEFTVRDNGIGIEAESLDRIFLVFQRLHGMSKCPGTGIGLAICKKIVEGCGGKIWVESQVGLGSSFHFTLPAAD